MSIVLAGSDFRLWYSADRVPAWRGGLPLDAPDAGLAGWTFDVLDTLDTAAGVLETGLGIRRHVTPTDVMLDGQAALAVPSVDAATIDVFDTDGRHLRTIDGATGITQLSFGWDATGLATITEVGGRTTRVIRDSAGTPVQVVTARGYRSQLGVLNGWLAAVVDPAGGVTHITTTQDGLVEVVRDPAGARTVFRYDGAGRVTQIDGPNDETVSFSVKETPAGVVVDALTGAGRGWTETVATSGSSVTRTFVDRGGATTTVVSDGSTRQITAADGTKFQLTLSPDPFWGMAAPVLAATATTPAGRTWTATEQRHGSVVDSALAVQAFSRRMTTNDLSWSLSVDPATRTLTSTGTDGRRSTQTFDEQGRPVSVTTPGEAPVACAYDSAGRLSDLTVGSGPSARVWHYDYDLASGAVTETNPVGDKRTFFADPVGNGVRTTTVSGSEVAVSQRDAAGRIAAYGGGALGFTHLAYRLDGRIGSLTLPPGDALRFTAFGYDADGVISSVTYADDSGIQIDRDGTGRPVRINAGTQTLGLTYDSPTSVPTGFDGPVEDLTRTLDGRALTEEQWSGLVPATLTRELDGLSRITADDVNGQSRIAYEYDSAGQLTRAGDMTVTHDPITGLVTSEEIGSLERTWHYDDFGAVAGETITANGVVVYDLTITRDALGRVTKRVESIGNIQHIHELAYDDAGRLASATYDGVQTGYAYDASGDLISETGADTVQSTYDSRGQLLTRGDASYNYDGAGRLASVTGPGGATAYHYDPAGRLISVTLPTGKKVDFAYDGLARRVAKTVDGMVVGALVYADQVRPAAELNADGSIAARFVYDSGSSTPAYVVRDGKPQMVVADDAGTPVLIVDADTGQVTDQISSDVWGRGDPPPADVPFGLAGGIVDADTGLIRYGLRDYDPTTTRWTAPDPIGIAGGDVNLYRYAHDDPANRVDQLGTCDVVTFSIGGSVGIFGVSIGGSVGIGVFGQDAGVYATSGLGVGSPGVSAGVSVGCLWQETPGRPIDQFGGAGASGDLGLGEIGGGVDASFNSDGSRSLSGFHIDIGPNLGASGQGTHTGIICLTCWPHLSRYPVPLVQDPGSDPDHPSNLCDSLPLLCALLAPLHSDERAGGRNLGGPGSIGDPHLNNAAGFRFDFMGAGEFVALQSDSGDMVVQVRQVPYSTSRYVSVNSRVAMSDAGTRINVAFEPIGLVLTLDGVTTNLRSRLELPGGGFIAPEAGSFLIGWPDGSLLRVLSNAQGLDLSMKLMPDRAGTVHGMLGPYPAEAGYIVTQSGERIDVDPASGRFSYDDLYRKFGDSWRITQAESFFDYAPGESTATFDDRTFPDPNPPPIDPATTSAAQKVCADAGVPAEALDACVVDVSYTGDPGWAVTTAASTRGGAATIDQVAVGQVYPINVGDTVTPGDPVPGAGVVDAANEVDQYTFSLDSPQAIYLGAVPGCTALSANWSLLGPTGELVMSDGGVSGSSICFDLGRYSLPAGSFTIRVAGGAATETYSFSVTSVAGTNSVAINLDQVVGPGVPSAGSGELTTSGETDLYTFNLGQPQQVYLDSLACPDIAIGWQLLGSDGAVVTADNGPSGSAICFDLGTYTLPAGSYTIKVSTTAATGTYSFEVWSVPPIATIPLGLSQVVSQGQPSSGAGEITTPGETDLYTFSLPSPQTVYLDSLACPTIAIGWQLLRSDGAVVTADNGANGSAMCFDLGAYTLGTGSYTVRVGTSDGVGLYSFEVASHPPPN